jgi:tape measure domain-containing protein
MANSIAKLAILLTTDTSGMSRGFAQARSQVQGLQSSLAGIGGAFGLGSVAAVGAALAAGLAAATRWSVQLAEETKIAQLNFRTMMGDAAQADAMLGGIKTFAMNSAFSQGELQSAAQTMLAFGMAGEKVVPTLRTLGDISLGNSDKLKMLTLAFSQTQAAGRLMGQDLLQMVNAGFNPLQEISRVTGKDIGELRKEMESGAITAQMVALAFKSAAEEGGRFNEALKAQEKTLSGQWSKLMEGVGEQLRPFGSAIGNAATGLLMLGNDVMAAGQALWSGNIVEYAASLERTGKAAGTAASELAELANQKRFVDAPKGDFLFNIDRLRAAQGAVTKIGKGGEEFAKRFRTPAQEFTASVAAAAELLRDGGISAQVYARAIAQAKDDLLKSRDTAKLLQDALQPRQNTALARSSGSAFSEIMRAQQQAVADAAIQQAQLAEEKRANGLLEKIERGVNRNEQIKINEVDF